MARTPSTMAPLGMSAPPFALRDTVSDTIMSLESFIGADRDARGLLVIFMCNHCPFVHHVAAQLAQLGREYHAHEHGRGGNIAIVGINANDTKAFPYDAPDKMKDEARTQGYTFPYLFDSTQKVAQAYGAACTPDFFLFDGKGKLVYRGQLDDSRPGNDKPVTGADLRAAMDALLHDTPVATVQKASMGCNIKWIPGNEPAYFG